MIVTMEHLTAHPLYVRWKALKSRRILCAAWASSFTAFRDGVGDRPPGSKKLARIDDGALMGPLNFRWTLTPSAADQRRYVREWHQANPEYSKDRHFKARYGITFADYQQMHADRDGKCDICGNRETHFGRKNKRGEVYLCVDHDHETGAVRGLLCGACNVGLGALGDNALTLLRAVGYLRQHERERAKKRLRVVE